MLNITVQKKYMHAKIRVRIFALTLQRITDEKLMFYIIYIYCIIMKYPESSYLTMEVVS